MATLRDTETLKKAVREGIAELETIQGLLQAIPTRMRVPWQIERLEWIAKTIIIMREAIAQAEETP